MFKFADSNTCVKMRKIRVRFIFLKCFCLWNFQFHIEFFNQYLFCGVFTITISYVLYDSVSFKMSYENNDEGDDSHHDVSVFFFHFLICIQRIISLKIRAPLASNHGAFKCMYKWTEEQLLFLDEVFHCNLAQSAHCITSLYNAAPVTISHTRPRRLRYSRIMSTMNSNWKLLLTVCWQLW